MLVGTTTVIFMSIPYASGTLILDQNSSTDKHNLGDHHTSCQPQKWPEGDMGCF